MTIITFTHSIGIIIVIILLFLTTFFLRLCLSFLTALQNIDGFSSLETRSCPGLPSSLGDTCHMVRHSFFRTVSMSRNHNQPDHLKTIFYITCHIILLQRPLWNLGILFFWDIEQLYVFNLYVWSMWFPIIRLIIYLECIYTIYMHSHTFLI